jgi:hypothetical protein
MHFRLRYIILQQEVYPDMSQQVTAHASRNVRKRGIVCLSEYALWFEVGISNEWSRMKHYVVYDYFKLLVTQWMGQIHSFPLIDRCKWFKITILKLIMIDKSSRLSAVEKDGCPVSWTLHSDCLCAQHDVGDLARYNLGMGREMAAWAVRWGSGRRTTVCWTLTSSLGRPTSPFAYSSSLGPSTCTWKELETEP